MMDAVVLGRAVQQHVREPTIDFDHALAVYNDNTVLRGKQLWQSCRRIAEKHAPEGAHARSPAALVERGLV
jgi:hypothetical protein